MIPARYPHDGATVSPALPSISIPAFGGFMICPAPVASLATGGWAQSQSIYRIAYEQALAALRPRLYERLATACLN